MDAMLKELFGGDDDDRKPQARDFVTRVEQGNINEGYSDNEAYENFQRVAQHAKPETIQRAAEQAFSRMDPSQRTQLAQLLQQQQGGQRATGAISDDPRQMAGMVSQIHRETPGGLSSLLGGAGGAAGGATSGGGGIGETLGNLFGGGGGDQPQTTAETGGGRVFTGTSDSAAAAFQACQESPSLPLSLPSYSLLFLQCHYLRGCLGDTHPVSN